MKPKFHWAIKSFLVLAYDDRGEVDTHVLVEEDSRVCVNYLDVEDVSRFSKIDQNDNSKLWNTDSGKSKTLRRERQRDLFTITPKNIGLAFFIN